MPAISVIIPTYNCARYLAESLDSIYAQTADDFEVIVVDDGSTDDTPDVLARYAGRVQIVHGDHGGLAAARNVGLGQARGQWVAFHDADDVALPDRLAVQRQFLRAHPEVEAVFCNGERIDAAGGGDTRVIPAEVARRSTGHALTAADVFAGYPVYFQGALVPRQAFEVVGPFDPTLQTQPDIEYGYRLFPRCRSWFIDRVVFRYRRHTTNTSSNLLGTREDIARILDRLQRVDAEAVRLIGARRLRACLARHYYRIARRHLVLGHPEQARVAVARAVELRPLDPRYRLLQLWHGR